MNITKETIGSALEGAANLFASIERDYRLRLVFLGGAAVPLYADVISFDSFGPTKDLDVVASIVTDQERRELETILSLHGLKRDSEAGFTDPSDALPFRWWLGNRFQIDILSTDLDWGDNHARWFKAAWRGSFRVKLPGSGALWLADPPAFIASKFDAFLNRKKEKDLRDVLTVVATRSLLHREVAEADMKLRNFIGRTFQAISQDADFENVISDHFASTPHQIETVRSKIGSLAKIVW